ncbi:MAG TPA: cupin domain-containing protein [Solirubrobacteraceae bacterium]|nr:cupin domain-containing protein [Solirubrobacteraceae bacterium]
MTDDRHSRVYAVAGGNHVMIVVDATETDGTFDLIEVLARPGGGPPPHRHAFAEWFHVLEGSLQILTVSAGRLEPVASLGVGQTFFAPPWVPHTTRNLGEEPVRFLVAGRPRIMTSYFAHAGVLVPDVLTEPDTPPPGPRVLGGDRGPTPHRVRFDRRRSERYSLSRDCAGSPIGSRRSLTAPREPFPRRPERSHR